MSTSVGPARKRQECALSMVWLTWLGLPAMAGFVAFTAGWLVAAIVLVVGIAAQVIYIRQFARLSTLLGYGSVDDVPARAGIGEGALLKVTLYTANVCPFCPVVRKRLRDLRTHMPFELEEVDVTFQPQLVRAKGLRSVPAVEVDGRLLVGNATSADLAAFLAALPGGSVEGVRSGNVSPSWSTVP